MKSGKMEYSAALPPDTLFSELFPAGHWRFFWVWEKI